MLFLSRIKTSRLALRVNTIWHLARRLAPSLAVFVCGAMSIYIADIVIRSLFEDHVVRDWAVLKSIVFTLSSFAAIGLDQALIREPSKWNVLKYSIFSCVIVISVTSAAIVYITGIYERFAGLAAAIVLISMGNVAFSLLRVNGAYGLAFIARDGWKVLFLIGVVISYYYKFSYFEYVIISCALFPAAASLYLFYKSSPRLVDDLFDDMNGFFSALKVGFPFAISSASLSIAIYSEIALLRILGDGDIIADYFVANICFVSSILMVNTFVASVLVGYVRRDPARWVRFLKSGKIYFLVIFFVSPLLSYLSGYILNIVLFSDIQIPYIWAVFMSLTAGLRMIYTLISVTVGSLSDKLDVTKTSIYYLLSAVCFMALAILLNYHIEDAGAAMAIATAFHWLMRSLVGVGAVGRVMRRYSA